MLIYAKNRVFEIIRAEIVSQTMEVKKVFKTETVPTGNYMIELFAKGASLGMYTDAVFTREEADNLLYELYQNGKLDLSEYI